MIQGTRVRPEFEATVGQWFYLSCECFVQVPGGGVHGEFTQQCAACGNTNLRYMHTLRHEEDGRIIEVGIECARLLVDDDESEIPRLAENETKRKENWRIYYRKPGRCVTTVDNLIEKGKL